MTDGPSARKYFVAHNGRKYGPLSLTELSSRRLSDDMLAWCEGMPEWVPIAELPELAAYVRHAAASRMTAPPSPPVGGATPGFGQTHAPQAVMPGIEPFPVVQTGARPAVPTPPAAPNGRVKFLGITSIVLASLGLLCCPLVLLGTVFGDSVDPAMQDIVDPGVVDPGLVTFGRLVIHGLMFLVSIGMMVAGIGLLKHRRWAGVTGIVCSIVCLVTYLGGLLFECGFVQWPLMSWAAEEAAEEVMGMLVLGAVANGVAGLVGMAWHVVNIVMLNSAAVRSALR